MDPQELERRKQEARDQGYSEEEIRVALGESAPAAPITPAEAATAPPPNVPAPIDRSAEQNTTMAMGAALGAGAVGIPAAIAYGLRGGMRKGAEVMDVAKQGVGALQEQNATNAMRESRMQNRPGFGGAPAAAPVPGPVAPTSTILGANGLPMQSAQPAAQIAQPAAQTTTTQFGAKSGSMLDNASQIVRKLALSKIIPAAEVAQGLFYTSPEEIATLKAAEERRKRAGQPR
jgi:hypothetical protein